MSTATRLLPPPSVKPEFTLEDWVVWLNLFNRLHPRLYASLMLHSYQAGRRDYRIQRALAGANRFGFSTHHWIRLAPENVETMQCLQRRPD
jgi:hypothetical protein